MCVCEYSDQKYTQARELSQSLVSTSMTITTYLVADSSEGVCSVTDSSEGVWGVTDSSEGVGCDRQ